MRTISIVVPTFNEEDNVESLCKCIINIMENSLNIYKYEILFIDNQSHDNTRYIIRKMCSENKCIKAIFNAQNFGYLRSPYHGLCQSSGDCAILMSADFQDPPELILELVSKWEEGYKVVIAQKTSSKENKLIFALRKLYYSFMNKISDIQQIEQFTCFGLYDKEFINILRGLHDSRPYMRGIVAELGIKIAKVKFTQPLRKHGESSSNFKNLYDQAMLGVTSYSKTGLRSATFLGGFTFLASIILSIALAFLQRITITNILLLVVMLIGSIILIYIGILGEYILNMNIRLMKRPLVVEEERINIE